MERILFCNIAYMQYYDFETIKETPKYGGQYVADTGDAYEKHNFHVCADNKVRGFVETKYRSGYQSGKRPNQIRIENIDSKYKQSQEIDDVTVVFCAYSETLKKTVIVGWYKHAKVFRGRLMYNGKEYNIECLHENMYLVDEKLRTFIVPRAASDGVGFGQANVWYAKEERAKKIVESVLNYIEEKVRAQFASADEIPQEISPEYKESGIGKRILVNKYERNSIARRRSLELHGTSCAICGFNAAQIYEEEFRNKIEVHHVVPIHEVQQDYKVDPETDLIPVCPNCHMILHTKMKNGQLPTIDELRVRLKKKNN